jgi:hypothetical protein
MEGAKGRTAKPTHFYLFEMLLQVLACRENYLKSFPYNESPGTGALSQT